MHYYVGWDVGGWNCDGNPKSRDALAVLRKGQSSLAICGQVFRGNIREQINQHNDLASLINHRCKTEIAADDPITLAIDTPLGLPSALAALVQGGELPATVPEDYSMNPYLYRQTEQWLFEKGFSPLSAIKDMIGSQATKGMHLIRRFGLKVSKESCGVWRHKVVTALETYPTPCKGSRKATTLFSALNGGALNHDDKIDAVYCALVAYLYAEEPQELVGPQECPPVPEGWIWIPADVVAKQ